MRGLPIALLLAGGCSPPDTAALSLTGDLTGVDNVGGVVTLHVTASDEYSNPGTGAVKVTSVAGSLTTPNTITLVAGAADVDFSCDATQDASCTGKVRVVAEWQHEGRDVGAELHMPVGVISNPGGGPTACIPSASVATATLRLTVDDNYNLWFNGQLIDQSTKPWNTPGVYTVTLVPGAENVIAIEAINLFNTDGLDRGAIAELLVSHWGTIVTDERWKVSATEVTGWETVGFDDSGWASATAFATNGDPP